VLLLREYVLVGANGKAPPPLKARAGIGAHLGAVRTREVLELIVSDGEQVLCRAVRHGAVGGAGPEPSPPMTLAWGEAARSSA
jgi:hypothetical protein